jgi:riboflavin kinase/FMN adenylyltransferase
MDELRFTASIVSGSKRGRTLGFPTLNLRLNEIPSDLKHGIYACFVEFEDSERLSAVMHYGPRPSFADTVSCEVHVLDADIPTPPRRMEVTVQDRIRDVTDLPLREALMRRIQSDIECASRLLRKRKEL